VVASFSSAANSKEEDVWVVGELVKAVASLLEASSWLVTG